MKIIALLKMKNESLILPTYLSAMTKFADKILAMDDGSTDDSRELVTQAGGSVFENTERPEFGFAERSMYERLLKEGRQRGGTHFVILDADETLSENFIAHGRSILKEMQPGHKRSLFWATLWKTPQQLRIDGIYDDLYKDVIFCDDGIAEYKDYGFLCVGRTPGPTTAENHQRIPKSDGAILHYQYVTWELSQIKQAWYRCSELLRGGKSPQRINHTYRFSLDDSTVRTTPTPAHYLPENMPEIRGVPITERWQYKDIIDWFSKYGILRFEPLQVWHVPELRERFMDEIGREPKSKTYSSVLILLNDFKNKIKNKL